LLNWITIHLLMLNKPGFVDMDMADGIGSPNYSLTVYIVVVVVVVVTCILEVTMEWVN
jgi:hypothetical protein